MRAHNPHTCSAVASRSSCISPSSCATAASTSARARFSLSTKENLRQSRGSEQHIACVQGSH